MILITYTILLPAGNTIQSMLQNAPELQVKMKFQGDYANTLDHFEQLVDYDPTDNKFVTRYKWNTQQDIDNFVEWANSNVGDYDTTMSEFTALINSIGGSLVKTTTEI